MSALDPRLSLVVLLGARVFPKYPGLSGGTVFSRSAHEFLAYMTAANGLGIGRNNVLDLFDDSRPAADQLGDLAEFLSERQSAASPDGSPENVFVYYVGHGLFTPTDRRYCLAIRCTSANTIGFSAMRGRDLAEVVSTHASHLRRFLIMDCCFAASILRDFLSAPGEAANLQMMDELPRKGTSLLCASSSEDVALGPQSLGMTMFTNALLRALREGNPSLSERMSIRELIDTVKGLLQREYTNWVRPELHTPDMRQGEISTIPFFPNPAWADREHMARGEAAELQAEQELKAEQELLGREAAAKAEQELAGREAAVRAEQQHREDQRAHAKRQKELSVAIENEIAQGREEATVKFGKGDYDGTITIFDALLRKYPDNSQLSQDQLLLSARKMRDEVLRKNNELKTKPDRRRAAIQSRVTAIPLLGSFRYFLIFFTLGLACGGLSELVAGAMRTVLEVAASSFCLVGLGSIIVTSITDIIGRKK